MKGFCKVFLKVDESKTVRIMFDGKTFWYWNVRTGKWSGELTINDAICQMYYAKSAIARFAYKKLSQMKKKSEESGKRDLNILSIYNMPFPAIAKMTEGW